MNKNLRKHLIVGNWKMHKTAAEALDLTKGLAEKIGNQIDVTVAICPPFTALQSVAKGLEGSNIALGAQNMHPEVSGAFTGEISAQMLRHHFVTYVILGHSERRTLLGETDAFINQKIQSALKSNLKPILCIGETLEERNHNRTLEVLHYQLNQCLEQVGEADADQLVIAYEPIWAIGTGETATPEVVQTVHEFIRSQLAQRFGDKKAVKTRILYGGSVKAEITQDLLNQPDIDGVLVGGASLEVSSFVKIVQAAIAQNQPPEEPI